MLQKIKQIGSVLIACLAVVILGSSCAFADDNYSVTVNNSGANSSTDIILEQHNIGAGFSEENNIIFRNVSSYNIRIDVENLEPLEDTGLLQYATFMISGKNGAVSGRYPEVSDRDLVCVQSGDSGELMFHTKVDYDLGNAYQATMFKVKAVFYMQAVEDGCKTEIADTVVNAPNTGVKSEITRYRMLFVAGVAAITGIIFLLPARRKEVINEKAANRNDKRREVGKSKRRKASKV